jgi:hypothetical protein
MGAIDEYSELVSSIYDAALDFEKWPAVLERLADALKGSSAVLRTGNLENNQGKWISVRMDPRFDQLYVEYYKEHHALWQHGGIRPVGSCESDREVIPKEELVRTEFYNDFLLPQDTHTALRTYVLAEADWQAVISVGRSPRRGSGSGSTSISCDLSHRICIAPRKSTFASPKLVSMRRVLPRC